MSKESGPKLSYDAEGHITGKYIFEDAWVRAEDRADSMNALCKTDLWKDAIELDKWNKMNAYFAKAPFSPRTLMEILGYIYLLASVIRDKIYRTKDHPTGFLGYFSTVSNKLSKLLKERDPLNSRIAARINSFKLGANISKLNNQLTLDMNQLITWRNIDKLEGKVKNNLKYFVALYKAQFN